MGFHADHNMFEDFSLPCNSYFGAIAGEGKAKIHGIEEYFADNLFFCL